MEEQLRGPEQALAPRDKIILEARAVEEVEERAMFKIESKVSSYLYENLKLVCFLLVVQCARVCELACSLCDLV